MSNPNIVYAYSNANILLKSTNGGTDWNEVISEGEKLFDPRELLVDPANPQILFTANTAGQIYRSTNGGLQWQPFTSQVELEFDTFFSLNTPPATPLRAVYLTENGTKKGIAVSDDGGEHWTLSQTVMQSTLHNKDVKILGIDPTNNKRLYATLIVQDPELGALYKSIDEGISWTKILPIKSKRFHRGLRIHPADGNVLYSRFIIDGAFDISQWFSSRDGGETWEVFGDRPSFEGVLYNTNDLALDPANPETLFINGLLSSPNGHQSIIAKSTDFGKNWVQIKTDILFHIHPRAAYIGNISVNPQDSDKLLMTSIQGVFSSQNGGLDWKTSNSGIHLQGGRLSVAQGNQDVMYLAYSIESYKSFDGGKNWDKFRVVSTSDIYVTCNKIVINPLNNQDIICIASNAFRSINSGENWILLEDTLDIREAVYTYDGHSIFVINYNSELIKFNKNQTTWESKTLEWTQSENKTIRQLLLDPVNSNIIYIVATVDDSTSVYKSVDAGESWERLIGAIHDGGQLLIHPNYPDRLIFLDGMTVSLTDNGGIGWHNITATLPHENIFINSLVFNPRNRDGIFLSTATEVYESKDLGKNWSSINNGLRKGYYPELQVVSDNTYASTDIGIFQLTDALISSDAKDCLFHWAEQQYPHLFSPALAQLQQFEDYTYIYYINTDTFLGFYQDRKVHLLEANKSMEIQDAGFVEYYQHLAGCNN